MTAEQQNTDGGEQRVISIEEAPNLYPDQWVLMQVTEHSDAGAPRAGIVLAAGSDEHVLSVMMEDVRSGCPRGPYDRFFAFKHVPSAEELHEIAAQVWIEEMEAIMLEAEQGRSGDSEQR